MKYKDFHDWFKAQDYNHITDNTREKMLDAWDACVNNMPDDPIAVKIKELLNTISDAEKIDCTCDKGKLSVRYPCICVRAGAMKQAGFELGKYLRELRGELKSD